MCSATGEQANPEHAEAGAALRDLRLPFPEDREGADLQARLRQGHQLRKSENVRECQRKLESQSFLMQCMMIRSPFLSEGQQAAHPFELQRHHL